MIIILSLVAILVALLSMPVEFQFDREWPSKEPASVKVLWCFGLVRTEIPLVNRRSESHADTASARKTDRRDDDRLSILRLLAQRRFRARAYRFVSSIWRAVDKRDINIRMRLGVGDPAGTGQLWAVLGPLSGWLHTLKNCSVALEPDFDRQVFEGKASGTLEFSPGRILAPAVAFACSPVLWRSIGQARVRS